MGGVVVQEYEHAPYALGEQGESPENAIPQRVGLVEVVDVAVHVLDLRAVQVRVGGHAAHPGQPLHQPRTARRGRTVHEAKTQATDPNVESPVQQRPHPAPERLERVAHVLGAQRPVPVHVKCDSP